MREEIRNTIVDGASKAIGAPIAELARIASQLADACRNARTELQKEFGPDDDLSPELDNAICAYDDFVKRLKP